MRYQHECVERIKSQMWSIWAPKCADMFRRAPPVPINGDAPAYYRSVATLQVGGPAAAWWQRGGSRLAVTLMLTCVSAH